MQSTVQARRSRNERNSLAALILMKRLGWTPSRAVRGATELGTGDILTLDSDFQQYRWRRNRPFEMMLAVG